MIARREMVLALALSALAMSFRANAQPQAKVWRIGFLATYARSANPEWSDAFKMGMRELGRAEGRDYAMEYRFADGDLKRLPVLAAELVALKIDLILAANTVAALAASKLTREIPIVIAVSADPVGVGLAASLSRPGGNVTGLTGLGVELLPKRLDLMRQMLPAMGRVGFVFNPDSAIDELLLKQFQSGAEKLGIKSISVVVQKSGDIAAAFQSLKRGKADAVFVSSTIANVSLRESLVEHAAKYRLPGMYGSGEFVELGGLISYSPNYTDQHRRAAAYVDKIFKGAKPGDLPVEQPTKFELVVNLKTARALGIAIPVEVMVLADKVIE
jgi:putative ABC transport system substrate-binding protein